MKYNNSGKSVWNAIEELSTAMMAILKEMIGPSRASLIDETSRVYGFTRTGPNIKTAMNEAIDYLIGGGQIEEVEGKLRTIVVV